MIITFALLFFDRLIEGLFLDAVKEKIKDHLDRRNVRRTISRCSEAPAQALEGYFRNEGIDKDKVKMILDEVEQVVKSAGVDARMLASASLSAEKLTEIVLSKYPIPQRIKEEELEWPFRMALQITADALCNIATRFSEWEKEAWRTSFEAFDKLLESQQEILRLVGPSGEGSLDDRFAHTYRAHVLRRLARIDASTFRISSSLFLDLTTVFVQPEVVKVPRSRRGSKAKTEKRNRVISLEEARRQILSRGEGEEKERRVPAESFIAKTKKCAIVGLPGSGKTTLLQHVLLASARGNISFGVDNGVIPVFVKARELDPANLPGGDDLLGVAEGKVLAGARPGFLKRQLETDRVLLLVDGLDEVVAEKRDKIVQWISDLVELYPRCRFVVSSRPAGYQANVFQKLRFNEATLCDFNTSQIREYVRRWTKAVEIAEGMSPEDANRESSRYAEALVQRAERNPYVRRIATNPLMLSTLCLVQRYEGGDLPNRRVALYQRCVEGLLFHWDKKRGLPSAILGSVSLDRKMMLMRCLALEMQVQGVAEIKESVVEQSFRDSLEEVGGETNIKLILQNIRDRSGLLVERRPGVYGFSHLTFQEYLAALSISHGDRPTYDRLFLFSRRSDPQWSEVIALYAGITSRDSVETLLKELKGTREPNSVLLCGECLAAAQNVEVSVQKEVVRTLLSLPDDVKRQGELIPVTRILESLEHRVVMGQVVATLPKLSTIHSLRVLYRKLDPKSVGALLEAGKNIIERKQQSTRWNYAISLILLLIEHSAAAKALDQLAELVSEKGVLGKRATVLGGIFSFEFRQRDAMKIDKERGKKTFVLRGVLKFLDEPSAATEQIHLCKFLAVAASKKVVRQMRGRHKSSRPFFRFSEVPDILVKKLKYLGQHGTTSVREHATQAATNLAANHGT